MPKPSSSRGSAAKRRGRGGASTRGGRRQNRRQEGLVDDRRPDSAVDALEGSENEGDEDEIADGRFT
jgi:hypothetical protein